MDKKQVPLVVVRRLPRYYRHLSDMLKKNITRTSSKDMSKKMGVTASQIRQDFNCFGGYGQQGYGYNVEMLQKEIGTILGMDRGYTTIIVGAGNLGTALANHDTFEKRGYKMIGLFDADKGKVGNSIAGHTVMHTDEMENFVKKYNPDIAILCVPKIAVYDTANDLVKYGVKALWNFTYTELELPDDVVVENVHLSDSLMTLSYRLLNKDK